MHDELAGDENLPEVLTASQPQPKKRGAPCQIEDGRLFSRRDYIIGALEYYWADVGWELQHARTPEQVRAALKPIAEELRHGLKPFLCDTPMECTTREFRSNLKVLQCLEKAGRPAYEQLEEAKDRLERVEYALKEHPTDPVLLQQLKVRKQRFEKAHDAQQEITRRCDELRDSVGKQRAHLAQKKVLGLFGCKRYEMSPTGLANGMAGLPEIGWRQSAARCGKKEPSHPYRNIYEMFLEIQRALPDRITSATDAVQHAKNYLKNSRNAYAKLLVPYYVRVAIEAAYSKKLKRGEAPYRVFAEYDRRSTRPSPADIVFADETF